MKQVNDENITSKPRRFKISKNYNLTKEEESKSITYINQLLKEFETQLDLLSLETTYYSIMPLGRKICQTMISLLLKKEGYFITEYSPFIEIIQFSYENNIIPRKYYKILNLIRRLANEAIHGCEAKYGKYLSFLKKFSEFINWFNITYSEKEFYVEEITLKINPLLKTSNFSNKNITPIMRQSPYSEYKVYKKEEFEDIHEINKLLEDYSEQLKLISGEKKFYYTFLGSTISEVMVKLLLKKEGHYNPNKHHLFYESIETLYEQSIIPQECRNFLHLIRKYRNEFIHGEKQSDKIVLSFLKAFNYFIQWFDNYYSQNYKNKLQIEECCELINSLTYDETNKTLTFIKIGKEQDLKIDNNLKIHEFETNEEITKIKKEINNLEKEKTSQNNNFKKFNHFESSGEEYVVNEEIKRLNEELKYKEELHQKQIQELNEKNEDILKKLDETGKQFERCMGILEEINKRGERIEYKIDNITNQITTIQSLTERQINNAESKEEIERIIETYISQCIDNIMNYSIIFKENQNYQIEKKKLIYSIGEKGWNKLCEKSKTFLITSKVMYNHLITMDDIIDYSGICVLVTKALEVEIHKRFFTNFLDYLYAKYGADYKKYHTALLYQNRKPLLSEKFTMGNIAFVMCYIENWNDTDEQKVNNKLKLMEYCKKCVFTNYNEEEIEKLLKKYASSIEEIREKYRNPSAHTNEIKRVDAEECFNLVLDIEKLLKKMLDSFDI